MSTQLKPRTFIVALSLMGISIVSTLAFSIYQERNKKESVPVETQFQDLEKNTEPEKKPTEGVPVKIEPTEPVKDSDHKPEKSTELNLNAPFYSQAPLGNWDFPWQEACEEASILLVANVYGNHNWSREEFNQQILDMVAWEKEKFGTYLDTTVAQTATIVNDYLHLKTVTHENPSYDDVKAILDKGHFVIMFFAGKQLGNPNFTNGGPIYHVVMVKGYKANNKIITHDVGTRNGANYIYNWSTLQFAMHDFATPIESGAKRVLEILPPKK